MWPAGAVLNISSIKEMCNLIHRLFSKKLNCVNTTLRYYEKSVWSIPLPFCSGDQVLFSIVSVFDVHGLGWSLDLELAWGAPADHDAAKLGDLDSITLISVTNKILNSNLQYVERPTD